MELHFKTKRSVNGHTYGLIVDTVNKTIQTNRMTYSDDIVVTLKQMHDIEDIAMSEGYRNIDNI